VNIPPLSPESTMQDVLRLRPRLAENLVAFGGEPWERPRATLVEVFRNHHTAEKFVNMAASVPVPAAGSPWNALPASHLADHLTQHHRDFFLLTVRDLVGFFAEWDSLDPEIVDIREDFDAFIRHLQEEIDYEETQFFPRVLRYDACLRDPRVNPEFNGGSLRIAIAYRRSHAPGLHPNRLGSLIERLTETHAYENGDTWAELLATRMEDFRAQFEEHERLESEELYPLALEMEKTLYNLSISGVQVGVGSLA
jgi:hypothetical protein